MSQGHQTSTGVLIFQHLESVCLYVVVCLCLRVFSGCLPVSLHAGLNKACWPLGLSSTLCCQRDSVSWFMGEMPCFQSLLPQSSAGIFRFTGIGWSTALLWIPGVNQYNHWISVICQIVWPWHGKRGSTKEKLESDCVMESSVVRKVHLRWLWVQMGCATVTSAGGTGWFQKTEGGSESEGRWEQRRLKNGNKE